MRAAAMELGRLRIADVAGERNVVAALERRRQSEDEKQWRTTEPSKSAHVQRVVVGGHVDDGHPAPGGDAEQLLEQPPLKRARRVVAEVVDPVSPTAAARGCCSSSVTLPPPDRRPIPPRADGAEDREDTVVTLGEVERSESRRPSCRR
jgi:hypothetical protein